MLANKKVYVGKYSKTIQEKAFKLGWKWRKIIEKQEVSYLNTPFIFFNEEKTMFYDNNVSFFNEHKYEEVTPFWIMDLEIPNQKPQWKDFGKVKGWYVDNFSGIKPLKAESYKEDCKNLFPTKEEAMACLALSQLCQWRDKYNEGWKPNWEDYKKKYVISFMENKMIKDYSFRTSVVLAFKSKEIRDKFLEDFKELIIQAKPLL